MLVRLQERKAVDMNRSKSSGGHLPFGTPAGRWRADTCTPRPATPSTHRARPPASFPRPGLPNLPVHGARALAPPTLCVPTPSLEAGNNSLTVPWISCAAGPEQRATRSTATHCASACSISYSLSRWIQESG